MKRFRFSGLRRFSVFAWDYGVNVNVYSHYDYSGCRHSTFCQGAWGKWGYSGPTAAGLTAYSSKRADWAGHNYAYYHLG